MWCASSKRTSPLPLPPPDNVDLSSARSHRTATAETACEPQAASRGTDVWKLRPRELSSLRPSSEPEESPAGPGLRHRAESRSGTNRVARASRTFSSVFSSSITSSPESRCTRRRWECRASPYHAARRIRFRRFPPPRAAPVPVPAAAGVARRMEGTNRRTSIRRRGIERVREVHSRTATGRPSISSGRAASTVIHRPRGEDTVGTTWSATTRDSPSVRGPTMNPAPLPPPAPARGHAPRPLALDQVFLPTCTPSP